MTGDFQEVFRSVREASRMRVDKLDVRFREVIGGRFRRSGIEALTHLGILLLNVRPRKC